MVSQKQYVFVPNMSIFENITFAQEMVHSLNQKTVGGNMMIKIDMTKTYDRIHWGFVLEVLHIVSFSNQLCDLISQCVKFSEFSMMMNGTFK